MACNNNKQMAVNESEIDTATHCYAPSARAAQFVSNSHYKIVTKRDTSHTGMVWVEGGSFMMGAPDRKGMPNEYPAHLVTVDGFWMDA